MAIVEAKNLTKVYRRFKRKEGLSGALKNFFHREYEDVFAVDKINFSIGEGELVGYIGPNGAGKSTTIKMLTVILIPTSGAIHVNGFVPHRERHEYTKNIGVVFGQRTQLWWDIPVIESFKLLQKVYQIPKAKFDAQLSDFKTILEIEPVLDVPVRKLSLGQRMRCDLVASMLHSPKLLFLDEPTIGLDVVGKLHIRDFLAETNRRFGITMILTTHDLKEIEELCKRLIIIDHGIILYDGTLKDLKSKWSFDRYVTFEFTEDLPLTHYSQSLNFNGTVSWEKLDPLRVKATFKKEQFTPAEIIEHVLKQCTVHDITIEEPSIEAIVSRIYAKGKA